MRGSENRAELDGERRSSPIGRHPGAARAGRPRDRRLEREDLAQQTARGVAVERGVHPRALISSSSCRAEALGLDAPGLVPEPNQRFGDRLHHRRRAADEYLGRRRGREPNLGQHRRVDPPGITAPARWRSLAGKGVDDPGPPGAD